MSLSNIISAYVRFPTEVRFPPLKLYANDEQELIELILKYNITKNPPYPCFVPVYPHGKINKLFFDLDSDRIIQAYYDAKKLLNTFPLARLVFSGARGLHAFLDFPEVQLKHPKETLLGMALTIIDKLDLFTADKQVLGQLTRVVRLPGTRHTKSYHYCVALSELKTLEETSYNSYYNLQEPITIRDDVAFADLLLKYDDFIDKLPSQPKFVPRRTYSPEVRSCISNILKTTLDGEPGHLTRIAIVSEMLAKNLGDSSIISSFMGQSDFNYKTTKKYVEYLRKRGYRPFKCSTLERLGICDRSCRRYRG